MKQHIEVSDLDQLSPKAKERLRQWWKPRFGDFCVVWPGEDMIEKIQLVGGQDDSYETVTEQSVINGNSLPLLSFGQMIELSQTHPHGVIHVGLITDPNEPCNSLWELCKQILESDEPII